MSDIVDLSPNRPLDRDGLTVPGALAYFYLSGTTTPQEVYTTPAGDVAHPIPLEADAEGVFPPIYSSVALKCTVTDASGNVLPGYPVDPVSIIPTGSGAAQISFEPTGDIPETNVQAAIERVQANLVAPLLAGGIGVTGNATPLANIDATTTASGAYRFETGATGTFPSGVTAAGGGTIRLWRETAAEAVMLLTPRGSTAQWVRTLTSGAWGAWARVTPNLTDLGASTVGGQMFVASSTQNGRDIILAPTVPTNASAVGQFSHINTGVGNAAVIPGSAGQEWAYFVLALSAGSVVNSFAGVTVGGTTIFGATGGVNGVGFAWRTKG